MDTEKIKREFAARQAARQALPPWAKALMLPTYLGFVFGISLLSFWLAMHVRTVLRPDLAPILSPAGRPPTFSFIATFLSSMCAGACLAIVPANACLWLIPPMRRILDQNAQGIPGATFVESMRQGRKAIQYVGIPCLLVAALIAWSPWV